MSGAASWLASPLLVLALTASAAADNCERSRDYILDGLAGDLIHPSKLYLDLYKTCVETLNFPNVKDAFILRDGTIAVDPARNEVMATASTLAQFCQRFPNASIRFLTPREQRQARTVGLVVMSQAIDVTSCRKLGGT